LQFQSLFLQIKVKKPRSFIILLIQANGRNFVQKYLAYMKLPVITIFSTSVITIFLRSCHNEVCYAKKFQSKEGVERNQLFLPGTLWRLHTCWVFRIHANQTWAW